MDPFVQEWLSLVARWAHVIAAITWIGHALFFNWLDASLDEPMEAEGDDVEGELWMVHSGGFYQVVKKLGAPRRVLERLHWFKWEAAATWLTGFLLLSIVYYMSSALLIKPDSGIGPGAAHAIGFGTLIIGWVIYDLVWMSPLARTGRVASALSFALLVGVAFGLTQVLSGRAAFIHVGALMGTIMVANVWSRIIPAQRNLLAAIEADERPDQTLALRAKARSVHNNYMTYPVIFIMISNHYYQTFGAELNWLILALLMVASAGVRREMNLRGRFSAAVAAVAVAAAGAAIYLTVPQSTDAPARAPQRPPAATATASAAGAEPIDPATAGTVSGTVTFNGDVPAPERLALVSECAARHDGPVYSESLVVDDGKLANAVVRVTDGLGGWLLPPIPDTAVEIDQAGCIYQPHVVAARAGQTVAFINSDPLLHNVHTVAEDNAGFNLAMPSQGTRMDKVFDYPEIVHARCDVHPWMSAYIAVVDHPFYAVTDATGAFTIAGLPPGDYTLEAWHETLGTRTATVTVPPSAEANAHFAF